MADLSELIADPAYKAGMEWLAQGNAIEALKSFETAVRTNEGHFIAWNNIGVLLHKANYVKEAENAFLKALSVQENYLDARINLINLCIDKKDRITAQRELEILRKKDPANPELVSLEAAVSRISAPIQVKDPPVCTIVTGTLNRPKLLKNAIQSVVAQSYPKWEMMVVNDGGADVGHIVSGFNDPRIKYFSMASNFGAAHSYNYAIYESRAPYIGYLADDDILYPNHVAVLVNALEKNRGFGAAYGDQYEVSCDLNNGEYTAIHDKRIAYSYDFDKVYMIAYLNYIPHPCLVHRRSIMQKCGYYDEQLTALIDWDLLRRMSFYTDFLHVREVTGEYYFPRNKQERISNMMEKEPDKWYANRRRLFSKRPDKPWDRMKELTFFLYCERLDRAVLEQIKYLFEGCMYPKTVHLLLDEYHPEAIPLLKGLDMPDFRFHFNSAPCGFKPTLTKYLRSYADDSWLVLLYERIPLDEAWFKKILEQVRSQILGLYQQPKSIEQAALYTEPQKIMTMLGNNFQ